MSPMSGGHGTPGQCVLYKVPYRQMRPWSDAPWVRPALMAVGAAWPLNLAAQPPAAPLPPVAIEDNSFFIEEAYNQEENVVQHISSFSHFQRPLQSSEFTFTEEWPLGSQRHQLSLTLPLRWSAVESTTLEDVLVN